MVVFLRIHPGVSIATLQNHDALLSMRIGLTRNLTLRRSFACNSITFRSAIATKSDVETTWTEETEKKKEEEPEDKKKEEEEVSIPPPPEKPEPGDCCGSGCVRCVWDVYYEELEEYNNKLSKSI